MDTEGLIEAVSHFLDAQRGCAVALDQGSRGGYQEHARLQDAARERIDEIVREEIDSRVSDAISALVERLSVAGIELPEL